MASRIKPTIIGSGIYNYDIIVQRDYPDGFIIDKRNKFTEKILLEEIGGTCGNVMCILAHLGWTVMPQAQFDQSAYGYKLKADLEHYGCDTCYIENIPNGGTTILHCNHQLDKTTGLHTVKFRATGPSSLFAKRKQLRVKDEVIPFLENIEIAPDVYFFDSPDAGPRMIATHLRQRGTLIYFEPETDKDTARFKKGIEIADIIKFSADKVLNVSFCDANDKLFIQTLGSDGLRFKLCSSEWMHIQAKSVDNVIDWEGCGDTTTAVFLDSLAEQGMLSINTMTIEGVRIALHKASEKASECTQYIGSKGWINK